MQQAAVNSPGGVGLAFQLLTGTYLTPTWCHYQLQILTSGPPHVWILDKPVTKNWRWRKKIPKGVVCIGPDVVLFPCETTSRQQAGCHRGQKSALPWNLLWFGAQHIQSDVNSTERWHGERDTRGKNTMFGSCRRCSFFVCVCVSVFLNIPPSTFSLSLSKWLEATAPCSPKPGQKSQRLSAVPLCSKAPRKGHHVY